MLKLSFAGSLAPLTLALIAVQSDRGRPAMEPPQCSLRQIPLTAQVALARRSDGGWTARLSFQSTAAVAHAYAKLLLPEGAQGGNPAPWEGRLEAGQQATLAADFTMPAGESFRVQGGAYALAPDGRLMFGRRDYVRARAVAGDYVVEPDLPSPYSRQAIAPRMERVLAGEPELNAAAMAAALPIAYGETQASSLGEAGRVREYFRFYGRAGDRVRISMWAERFDGSLRLFNPQGKAVAVNDDAQELNPGIPERGDLELTSEGHYVIEVSGAPAAGAGDYKIQLVSSGRRQSLVPELRLLGGRELQWTPPQDTGLQFQVERGCDGRAYEVVGAVAAAGGSFGVSQPAEAKSCSYRLAAAGPEWREVSPAVRVGEREGRAAASGAVEVQGQITYDNQETHSTPGVRQAKVEIRKNDWSGSTAVAVGRTNDSGQFSIQVPAGALASGNQILARVYATDRDVNGNEGRVATVVDGTVWENTYVADSDMRNLTCTGCTVTLPNLFLSAGDTADRVGPFAILDSVLEASLIWAMIDGDRQRPAVPVVFPSDRCGACYVGSEQRIHVSAGVEGSRDVLVHEYGHFVGAQRNFPGWGGKHYYPFNQKVDYRLAFSESWATFFAIAGQIERGKQGDTSYDDNQQSLHYNLEQGHGAPAMPGDSMLGDDNEGSVQIVLWDLYDNARDSLPLGGGQDTVSMRFQQIYETAFQRPILYSQADAPPDRLNRPGVDRMSRFYASLLYNFPDTLATRQPIRALYQDQRMNWPLPPDAPAGLQASGNASGVSLSWSGSLPSGAAYEIERGPAEGGPFSRAGTATVNQYTDTGTGTTAYYRVRVRQSWQIRDEALALFSAYSSVVSASGGGGGGGGGGGVKSISVGQTLSGTLSSASPFRSVSRPASYAEIYELTLNSGQHLRLDLRSSEFDTYLTLMTGAGALLATDDDSGGVLNSRLERDFSAGVYRIEVASWSDWGSGGYTLAVQAETPPPPPEVKTIAVGQTLNGALTTASGRSVRCANCYADLYQLTLSASRAVVITLNSTALDAFLRLMDSSGNQIAEDDDSGGGLNSRLARTLAAGVYKIEATTFNVGKTGAYQIAVQPLANGPDLVVTSLTSDRTGVAGSTIGNVEVRIENRGNAAAGPFQVGFFWSADASITTTDTFSGWYCSYQNGLAAGASSTCGGEVGVPASLVAGTYYFGAIADYNNQVAETDETNNARAADSGTVTISAAGGTGALADLRIRSFTTETAGNVGGVLEGNAVQVENRGSAASGSIRIGFYLSTNSRVTTSDVFTGTTCRIGGLNAGATATCTPVITIPVNLAPGSYYIAAIADDLGEVSESDETNNMRTADTGMVRLNAGGASLPDLTVLTFTADREGPAGGLLQNIHVTVTNNGTATAGGFNLGFYYASSPQVTTASVDSGWSCTNETGLAPGQAWSCGGQIGIPATLTPGTYYVAAIVDDWDEVDESNENNNVRVSDSGTVTVTGGGGLPDLTATALTANTSATVGGSLGGMYLTVRNQGTAAAGRFRVEYYLSPTPTLTTASVDTTWYCDKSSGLEAGEEWNCSGDIGIPSNLAPGLYYLLAVVDVNHEAAESNENNNVRAADTGPVTVVSAALPDLVVTALGADTSGTIGGTLHNMSLTLQNTGTAAAGRSRVEFYFSTTPSLTGSSVDTGWYCDNGDGLGAGANWTCAGDVGIPSTLAPGQYYLLAVADVNGEVAESNENNNVRAADTGRVTVVSAALPDLVVTSFTLDTTGTVGGTLHNMYTAVQNIGTAAAGRFRVDFYFSTTPNLTGSSVDSGWTCDNAAGLAAGQTWTCGGDLGIPSTLAPGQYYVLAVADAGNEVSESNENNNVRPADSGLVTVVSAALPDLVVTALAADTSGPVGGTLHNMSLTLQNIGTAAAGRSRVEFYFSTTPSLTGAVDTGWYCDNGDGLAAGGAWTCAGDVGIPSTLAPGQYYLLALADVNGEVSESNENNNLRTSDSGRVTVTSAALPDLVVNSLLAGTTGTPGGTLHISNMQAQNIGTAGAGPFVVEFYFSPTPTLTTSSVDTGWYCDNTAGLSAGGTWSCDGDIGIPSTLAHGTWYLLAVADDSGEVAESNENNNVRAADSGPITL